MSRMDINGKKILDVTCEIAHCIHSGAGSGFSDLMGWLPDMTYCTGCRCPNRRRRKSNALENQKKRHDNT